MHYIPEELTLHLTSIFKDKNDPEPDWFHVTSTRAGRSIGPNALNTPFNPVDPYPSLKDAKQKAAAMLGVDYTSIKLVHYLQPYVQAYEDPEPLVVR